MNQTLSPQARQLLALFRSSLWQTPVDQEVFSTDMPDWRIIGQLALEQTVAPLVFEAAFKLPPDLRPPKAWIRKALAFLESNRRTHILVDGCVAESVSRLREEAIDAILLKGQAYARAYPRPEMRQCGDIDLYVGESNYSPAYEAVKAIGWNRDEKFRPEAKHYGCSLNGVRIELHRIAASLRTASADRLFQEWSRNQLYTATRTLCIADYSVPVPGPLFDVVFVFLHLYHHFLNGGIGLRQVCDWTMLLHAHRKEIDVSELETLLKDFGLLTPWRHFTPVAVEFLGLPASECPLYSPRHRGKACLILRHVLKEGNFGCNVRAGNPRPDGYLAGKLHSFRRRNATLINKFRIDPKGVSRAFGGFLYNGIARIIEDKMERRR